MFPSTVFRFLIFSAAWAPALWGQPLSEFIQSAATHNPAALGQKYGAEKMEYLYEGESALVENPMLMVGYNNVPLSSVPALDQHPMSNVMIGVSQKIALPGEAIYRKEGSLYRSLSARQGYHNTWNLVCLQVTGLYHELSFLYEKKRLLTEMESALGDIVSVARALVSVNKMNSSQLLRLDADLSILRNQITETDGQIVRHEILMEKLSGLKPQNMTGESWILPAAKVILPAEFEIKNHPLYKQGGYRVQMSEAGKAHAEARAFPAVNLYAGYSVRQEIPGKDAGEDFISFQVSVPLPVYYPVREAPAVAAAQKELEASRQSFRAAELELLAEWESQRELAQKLLEVYTNYETEVLPKYHASYKAQLGALSSGTVTLLDVLEAYRMYLQVSINRAMTFRDLMKSTARLHYLSSPQAPPQENENMPAALPQNGHKENPDE